MTKHPLRKKVADLLDETNTSWQSRLVSFTLIFLILASVAMIILDSEPVIREKIHHFYIVTEIVSLVIFSIEYICRVWTAPDSKDNKEAKYKDSKARWKYITSFTAIIDLLAILPLLLSFFVMIDLRFLRVISLLRFLKLTRYNEAMDTLVTVVKQEFQFFILVIFISAVILFISASCIYLLEHEHQPEQFGSIFRSMWWAIVTLSTVGYGDVSPITPLGKIFAGVIMIVGIGLMALPAGILASSFSDHIHRKRKGHIKLIDEALEEDVLDGKDYDLLRRFQEKHGLSEEQGRDILDTFLKEKEFKGSYIETHSITCPKCGHKI